MKVPKRYLLFIAGMVWGIAGFNVLRIGVAAYTGYVNVWNLLMSAGVYLLFHIMVFGRLVVKHTYRIIGYKEERQFFWKFFDRKAFCIMVFMIAFGIGIRVSGICPDVFIAVFYTGLGASLFTAGILFLKNFIKEKSRNID